MGWRANIINYLKAKSCIKHFEHLWAGLFRLIPHELGTINFYN